jgi:hypothetical protein
LTIDIYTVAISAGIATGVGQEIVQKAWKTGEKWLNNYFKDHQQLAQDKAKENSINFLIELGLRVNKLEDRINDNPETKETMLQVLSDPDFSALLKDAIITSARTNSIEKHKLLAFILAEKLTKKPDSLDSLLANKAVEIVPSLSVTHLKMLAIITLIHFGPGFIPLDVPEDKRCKWYIKWLILAFSKLLPLKFEEGDMDYLFSISCLTINPDFRPIEEILFKKDNVKLECDSTNFWESKSGKKIVDIWDDIKYGGPYFVGSFIGYLVIDEILGEENIELI